ncbi:MAG: hypothetical protein Q4B90_10580 [Eubacteriales bacterium]|nr:hypothetical protein [Eubacteriales bacterium]
MEFHRADSTMKILKEKKKIYIEDVIGLFLDLSQDVQDENDIAVARLGICDAEKAVLGLCQVGRLCLFLLKRPEVRCIVEKKRQEFQDAAKEIRNLCTEEEKRERQNEEIKKRLTEAMEKVEEKRKELCILERKWADQEKEKKMLEHKCQKLNDSLKNINFEREYAYIQESEWYAGRMAEAWNAATGQMKIMKEAEEFKKMESQMEEEREQIQKKIESYREKIKAVIQMLEEAWEE